MTGADQPGRARTRHDAIQAAGRVLAQAIAEQDARTPREAAEAAHRPGGPSVDELERRITERRARAAGAQSDADNPRT